MADPTSTLCQCHSDDDLISDVLVIQSFDAVVYVIVCVINLPLHRLRHGGHGRSRNQGDVLGTTLAGGHDMRDGLPTVDQLVAADLLTQRNCWIRKGCDIDEDISYRCIVLL